MTQLWKNQTMIPTQGGGVCSENIKVPNTKLINKIHNSTVTSLRKGRASYE